VTQEIEPSGALRVLPESGESRFEAQEWEAAYNATVHRVYRFVHARVGNRPDAEDITAQVFTQALPRLRMNEPGANTGAYLFAAARTALADRCSPTICPWPRRSNRL
jgi:DNA-directed RNA polymerase specialized sigma24 family protein